MTYDDSVALINESVLLWLEEFKDVIDKRLLWNLIKYRIRQITIKYRKDKVRERRRKISDIEASLNSPGHNQNWIYDDVTQIFNMAPKPRDTNQGRFSALC